MSGPGGDEPGGDKPIRSARPTRPGPQRTLRRRIFGSFWFNLLAAFVVLALIQGFIVKLYVVPSGSMEQTLQPGDRLLVNRLAHTFGEPQHGDVIVFTAGDTWHPSAPSTDGPVEVAVKWFGSLFGIGPGIQHTLVKRVIATGGETVECCDALGRVLVDGEAIDEPYVYNDIPFQPGALDCASDVMSKRCFGTYTVPDGQYFVLGDNRSNSNDSIARCRGQGSTKPCRVATVRGGDVVGQAFVIVWPVSRWGGLPAPPAP